MTRIVGERYAAATDVVSLVRRLGEYYETAKEIADYLESPHPQLGGQSCVYAISKGRSDDVHRILDRLDSDGFL